MKKQRDLRGDLSKYPVDGRKIPLNLPAPHFHLITTGHLMAFECVAYGWLPAMQCGLCDKPLDLIWKHKPLGENFFVRLKLRSKRKKRPRPIPGTTWGEDVAPICRCCSFGKCPHKE